MKNFIILLLVSAAAAQQAAVLDGEIAAANGIDQSRLSVCICKARCPGLTARMLTLASKARSM
jgi:hypothetical protein